ncbi:5-bromo-4-chloroindolyl phosphate hydrolysis family protein [Eubacterium sp. 1001713B170207_170306_E7]|uniref:5-bromo-4-chloroindolyl phosphate hydrolysis family protein n=1 Tax=Eubacterium sp. 1001713B170207_170306_E7 TaxID=2787097 RepID=UPI0018992E88|nr:5-bromo-4-chloroindolyl phosphate hydrolysis family protein [Eubacterium sp. 1001713B170207_170306_E7]
MGIFKKLFGGNAPYKPGKLDLNRPVPLGEIFPDVNLAHSVLNELNKRAGKKLSNINEAVTIDDLKEVHSLKASGMEIRSLEGMEYLFKLQEADLSHNLIQEIPFSLEDVTRLNNKYKGGFILNLYAYMLDLSDNRFAAVPELVKQYRDKERNLFIDLSSNPVLDPEVKNPSAEGCAEVIRKHCPEHSDTAFSWLLYYINAYYLVKTQKGLIGYAETAPGDFTPEPLAFIKASETTIKNTVYPDGFNSQHNFALVNDRGKAAVSLKKAEQEALKKIIDFKLKDGLVPTGENEPSKAAAAGETLSETAVLNYYNENTDKLCPELFSDEILSDSLSADKKRVLEQKKLLKEATDCLDTAIQNTESPEISEKLKTIKGLTEKIMGHMTENPKEYHFSFEINYLPMTLDIVRSYNNLSQPAGETEENRQAREKIEASFDTIIEAFRNYISQFEQNTTIDLHSDIDSLLSLFESHGLTDRK